MSFLVEWMQRATRTNVYMEEKKNRKRKKNKKRENATFPVLDIGMPEISRMRAIGLDGRT